MQTFIQMVTTTAAAASALASIDIPEDGTIEGISWDWSILTTAGTEASQKAQLSFGSAANAANDSRQVIDNVSVASPTVVAATVLSGQVQKYTPMNLQVAGGERIYLHTVAVGTAPASMSLRCMILLRLKSGSGARSRYRT